MGAITSPFPSDRAPLASTNVRHFYFETEYPQVAHQSLILEANGYIEDISQGAFPKYRMTERFVEHLRAPTAAH